MRSAGSECPVHYSSSSSAALPNRSASSNLEFVGVHRFVILGNVKPALGELQPDRHPEVKRALLLQPDLRGLVVDEVLEEDVTNLG